MDAISTSKIKSVTVEAVVTRADGRIEDLGTIAYWHSNPFKLLAWKLKNWIRGRKAGTVKKGN